MGIFRVSNGRRTACQAVEEASGDLRKQASQVAESVREAGKRTRDIAQEGLGQLRNTSADVYEQGRERAAAIGKSVSDTVEQRPWLAVVVAAIAGMAFWAWLMRPSEKG